eukprot:UN07660
MFWLCGGNSKDSTARDYVTERMLLIGPEECGKTDLLHSLGSVSKDYKCIFCEFEL